MPADIPIDENDRRIQYVSTGGEGSFSYDFPIFDETHIEVFRADDATTDPVTLALTVDYTVTGVDTEAGGAIVPVVTPISGQIWTLAGQVPEERTADFQQAGAYKAATVNREEDLQAMMLQQLRRDIDRTVRLSQSDPSTDMILPSVGDRSSKFLAFDASGDMIAALGTSANLGPVTAFIDTLLDDINALTARATLGVVIGTDVLAPTGDGSGLSGLPGSPTGVISHYVGTTAPTGWLLLNGDTIGSAGSGADHAAAGNETLYSLFWDSMADAQAPVSTGRGASAAADFAANKTLTMPDARGRSLIMTGQGASLTNRVNGIDGGEEAHVLLTAEMASHTHGNGSLAVASGGSHSHGIPIHNSGSTGSLVGNSSASAAGTPSSNSAGAHGHSMSGAIASAGSDTAHENMQPFLAINLIVKV